MFSFKMERSRSDSSASSFSSVLSLSSSGWTPRATLSPATTTTTPLGGSPDLQAIKPIYSSKPGLIRLKRAMTAPDIVPTYETFCPSSGRGAFGYPCWPSGESLSAGSSPASSSSRRCDAAVPPSPSVASAPAYAYFQPPTSRISDDDLEQLDFSTVRSLAKEVDVLEAVEEVPCGLPDLAVGGISWSQVGGGADAEIVPQAQEQPRRRLPPPPPGMAMGDTRRRKRVPSRSSSRGAASRRRISPTA